MKIKELKHNHTLTDLLKVILFSIVMLLPFFSVLTKSLYVICNKNAKDSYYGETINEEINVNIDYTDLKQYNTYFFENETITPSATTTTDSFLKIQNFSSDFTTSNIVKVRTYISDTYASMYFYDNENADNNNYVVAKDLRTSSIKFTFEFVSYLGNQSNRITWSYFNYFYQTEYNEYSYLDNAFEYSIYQLENSNLYNWTKTTGTYTGINAMCNGIGVNMDVIPMILTYWFLMSVIYIVLDIVIRVITYLTHMIGSKSA